MTIGGRVFGVVALVLTAVVGSIQPAQADAMPVQLERVIHDPSQLPGLRALSTHVFAGAFGGTLDLDAALRVRNFQQNGGFGPIDHHVEPDTGYHVLGGAHAGVFLGHEPVTSVLTGTGNPADTPDLSSLPSLDLYATPTIDSHELLTDARGNYWYLTYPLVDCDAHAGMCGPNSPQSVRQFASCTVNQVSPTGQLLFEWNAIDHLPQSELRYDQWVGRKASTIYARVSFDGEVAFADPYHCNSIDVDVSGNHFLVSMRHTDSVYMINKNSKRVLWKVGGNRWPGRSLAVTGLPKPQQPNPLSGQHDARFLGADAISVFDNSTGLTRPARGVIFDIDRKAREASARRVMSSPFGESSNCTGSFRQLSGGRYWVAGWGCTMASATVFDSSARPIVSLRPSPTAETKAYFAAIWPGVLSDMLVQQLAYRFTPSGDN